MPRVLMLARHFPPIGGAGVHRSVGTVRHLRAQGYEPVVVTGPAQHRDRWNPHDPGLMQRVPADIEVHRVAGPEPTPRAGVALRMQRVVQAPTPWAKWWVERAGGLGRQVGADADLVLASCVPYETAFAGARLAAALGTPWIADLEDPWALDEMRLHPTALHRARDRRRMVAALSGASAVVTAAPEAALRIERAMPELAGRVTGIPIGYEDEDFAGAVGHRVDGAFRIVHTGSLHTDLGLHLRQSRRRRRLLGGTIPGLDILTRSHVFLVEAIAAALAADPSLAGRIELHLAGELTPADRAVGDRYPFVRTSGLLPHDDTVALMRSADLLFLPMHDLPAGIRAGLIPYKTYEYLAARRPILAAVPDGDVRDMLSGLEHVSLVRPADVDGMTRALRAGIADPPAPPHSDSPPLRRLDRRTSVAQIARVLDAALSRPAARAPVAA